MKEAKNPLAILKVLILVGLTGLIGLIGLRPCLAGELIQITDTAGRQVSVPKSPDRIICLGTGTLRLVVYLESHKKIVGVEDFEKRFPTTRPYWIARGDEMAHLPSIGPGGPGAINKEPDLEKVLAVKPDVIFITYLDRGKAEALQKKIGIPVVVLTYGPFGTFDEKVYDSLRLCGAILDKQNRAEAVIRFIENSRKDLLKRIEPIPEKMKPSVYIGGIGFRGTHGIESTETEYLPFEWVRANPVAKRDGRKGHRFLDKEKILSWDPDIIFIDSGGNDLIRRDYEKKPSFYQGLKAFKNKKVYLLYAFNWYMTNIETVIVDAYAVGKMIYPENFKDVKMGQKADEIYSYLLGRPIHEKMERAYGKIGENPSYLR
ncbi:MAG TPA: iron ABC transporter substrate-binding protein [Syntrophales bacterium]|jgi:iron complex transport system substrate-binding protein|nr:iron ABC transporter substrate-binding protein [Smithellaceae bacterium]HPL64809.1 iron ABC transporter substrate-binding protein [Syntrophales bacterium]